MATCFQRAQAARFPREYLNTYFSFQHPTISALRWVGAGVYACPEYPCSGLARLGAHALETFVARAAVGLGWLETALREGLNGKK